MFAGSEWKSQREIQEVGVAGHAEMPPFFIVRLKTDRRMGHDVAQYLAMTSLCLVDCTRIAAFLGVEQVEF